jgi:hypothetical protein
MARIQVLYLPGLDDRFALIIDQCDDASALGDESSAQALSGFCKRAGAVAMLVTTDTLDVV